MKRLLIAGMMPACVLGVVWFLAQPTSARMGKASNQSEGPDRSPIALALSKDGTRLLSANQTAGTISWVDVKAGQVLAEIAVGDKPAGVVLAGDRKRGVVTNWFGYDLAVLDLSDDQPKVVGKVEVGPEPRGVVLSADGSTAYVAVGASNEVVRVDCEAQSHGPRDGRSRAERDRLVAGRIALARRQRARQESHGRFGQRLVGRADLADRRRQSAATIDKSRWPNGLRRRYDQSRIRDHEQQHRPRLGFGSARSQKYRSTEQSLTRRFLSIRKDWRPETLTGSH